MSPREVENGEDDKAPQPEADVVVVIVKLPPPPKLPTFPISPIDLSESYLWIEGGD